MADLPKHKPNVVVGTMGSRPHGGEMMAHPLTNSEDEALAYLYGGGDEVIECHSASWVKTRFPQKCLSILHKGEMTLPAGSRMVMERAKVEGRFGRCYTCESCLEAAARKLLGEKGSK